MFEAWRSRSCSCLAAEGYCFVTLAPNKCLQLPGHREAPVRALPRGAMGTASIPTAYISGWPVQPPPDRPEAAANLAPG